MTKVRFLILVFMSVHISQPKIEANTNFFSSKNLGCATKNLTNKEFQMNKIKSVLTFATVLQHFNLSDNLNVNEIKSLEERQKIILRLISICLVILVSLSVFLFWSRRKALISNKILIENNDYIADLYEEIRQQFDIIKLKNDQLDKYQNHLEILVEERTKEMMAAKAKAKESDVLKSTLLSNIYHEIRTPLNAIIGFTQLLSMDENFRSKEYLRLIDKNADSLLTLVDNIIDLSKLQSENITIEKEKVGLKKIMDNIFKETILIKETSGKEKVEIVPEFEQLQSTDYFYTNRQVLEKIMKHLIDNALKYTEQGKIFLGCKVSNHDAKFYVGDTGIGIERDKIPAIFDAFHKIEDHNNLHRGIGIGLSLSKQLSDRINGNLSVESELKKGTKFTLSIPV